jgi:hypothetical protein
MNAKNISSDDDGDGERANPAWKPRAKTVFKSFDATSIFEVRKTCTIFAILLSIVISVGYKGGRFPVFSSCVSISNPDSLSRSKTGVNPGLIC